MLARAGPHSPIMSFCRSASSNWAATPIAILRPRASPRLSATRMNAIAWGRRHFLVARAGILETDHLQPLDEICAVGITKREAEPQNGAEHGHGIVGTAGARGAALDLRCAP